MVRGRGPLDSFVCAATCPFNMALRVHHSEWAAARARDESTAVPSLIPMAGDDRPRGGAFDPCVPVLGEAAAAVALGV
jgi:hypothetical protein